MSQTSDDLFAMLRTRYQPPEWHVEAEVTYKGRRMDAVAWSLWGARQWQLRAFEIKVSRADWLRELANLEKADDWWRVADGGMFVVAPKTVILPGEVPHNWGHLEARGSRLYTVKHAIPEKSKEGLPREIAARFFARLEQHDSQQRRVLREESLREARKTVVGDWERKVAKLQEDLQAEREKVKAFEAGFGVEYYSTNAERTRRVAEVLRGMHSIQQLRRQIASGLQYMQRFGEITSGYAQALERAKGELEALEQTEEVPT